MSMVLYLRRVDENGLPEAVEDVDAFYDYLFDEGATAAGDLIDFDKAWGAIHFLLNGSAWDGNGPLNLFFGPWPEIGEDSGYGPPRLAPAEAMRAFDPALSAISDEELHRRYDPSVMAEAEVYIADALVKEGEDGWSYVAQGLPGLRRFASKCAEHGSPAIVVIS